MPTSTVEDYLKCILLEQQQDPETLVSMRQISSALAVAPGTVTAMVKTLADSGLLTYEPYSGVRLTGSGRQLALHVLRRHRLIELFLVRIMGMNWSEVHSEAEELEHAVSDRLIGRIDEMLGFPSVDPHGDPIPDVHGSVEEVVLPTLLDCELNLSLKVARVGDQSRDFLQLVERRGLKPGSLLRVEGRDEAADAVELRLERGEPLMLGFRAASKIYVEPLSAPPTEPAGGARSASRVRRGGQQ
jgi:DtxR family Mn-dependent transcriptional regulator